MLEVCDFGSVTGLLQSESRKMLIYKFKRFLNKNFKSNNSLSRKVEGKGSVYCQKFVQE